FLSAFVPVLARHPPESAIGQHLYGFTQIRPCSVVSFAAKGQQRIRAGFDTAIDATREMYPEEGEPWVGHRVDQVFDQMSSFTSNLVVFPPERNDLQIDLHSRKLRDLIAVKPGAINEIGSAKRSCAGLDHVFVAIAAQSGHLCPADNLSPA